jgi:ornithine cyclodeaminase/alanine dehydrogenase-like protein (mu-crystallin family)
VPKTSIRFFSAKEIKQILTMQEAIEIMKEAFIQITKNQAIIPPRIHLSIPKHQGDSLIMPIYMPSNDRIGLKLITLFDENQAKGLPLIHALVLIFDATNGKPLAIMDGSYLTALRTGAGSGLASKLLARKDSKVAAIFGAGKQGETQLEAVCAARDIEKVLVFDPDKNKAKTFSNEMNKKLKIEIKVAQTSIELKKADIICTATNSQKPVFSEKNLKNGVHINAIGSYKPHIREIPSEAITLAKIVVDHRKSALSEAGDLIIPIQQKLIKEDYIHAELGEILLKSKSSRESNDEITIFKSVGNAIQDLVTANQVLLKAEEMDIGTTIQF